MALRDHMSPEEFRQYRREIVRRSQQKRRSKGNIYLDDQHRNERFRRDNKQHLIALLGGRCKRCKWAPCSEMEESAMDFHHRDPSTKGFEISQRLSSKRSTLEAEALKCDLLCARCHRIIEAEIDARSQARERRATRTHARSIEGQKPAMVA